MGVGMTPKHRISGPLRIGLQRYPDKEDQYHIWWLMASHSSKMKEGFSSVFEGIESALSDCVQSCLAVEPIFAVSLSLSHTMSPDIFRKAFRELYKDSPQQWKVQGVDGELNEYLMLAVLQMACRADDGTDFPNTRTVAETVERMGEYLSPPQPGSPPTWLVETAKAKSGYKIGDYKKNQSQRIIKYFYGLAEGDENENAIKHKYEGTKMPWLVPACSHERLREKIQEARKGKPALFPNMKIAGLVPGVTNSCLDASAYLWECENQSNTCAPLAWMFEFKGRSASYSLEEATTDLVGNCNDAFKTKNEGNAHSMLVALTGNKKTECRIWLEDAKLRVVLLVGTTFEDSGMIDSPYRW